MIPFMWNLNTGKPNLCEKKSEKWLQTVIENDWNGHEEVWSSDRNVPFWTEVVAAWIYTFVKTHWIVHLISVNFTIYKSYLNQKSLKQTSPVASERETLISQSLLQLLQINNLCLYTWALVF